MQHIWSVARKELRAAFQSAVAPIFLGLFVGLALFVVFWHEDFFSRRLADLSPLFEWLPRLLVLLVAALTMRAWSEERRSGTEELLLTLPVPARELVVGKFVAVYLMLALALGLTLGLPLTVSMMGNLDWGPVIGGYAAAMLLGAAYISLGLFVSATTSNQIVALFGTVALGALFYLPGAKAITEGFGYQTAEILRAIGTGSRFDSVARGVLDLRDLAYYAALTVTFLAANAYLLSRRRFSQGPRGRKSRAREATTLALIAANAIAINLWLAPLSGARVDLTDDNRFSLSSVTEDLLASLDQPLLIRGYFSAQTHPRLDPLVPRIRNLLEEYAIAGGPKVRFEWLDPSQSEDLEVAAKEEWNIDAEPFVFETRSGQSVVNGYFHLLIAYGDQNTVLRYRDLIDVRRDGDDIAVELKNLEYDLTKTIKKVVAQFHSFETLFSDLPGGATIRLYTTPDTLPDNLRASRDAVEKVARELAEQSGGAMRFETVTPSPDQAEALFNQYGLRPLAASLLGGNTFYFHLVVEAGGKAWTMLPPTDGGESAARRALREALERATPGFVKTVGLVTPSPQAAPPQMPGMPPQQPRPPLSFQTLRQRLSDNYEVQSVFLDSGTVPDAIDALVLAGPENLSDKAVEAVDQFLMRGGAVIALVGRYRFNPQARELQLTKVTSGLEKAWTTYGLEIADEVVLDERSDALPVPVRERRGGVEFQRVRLLKYPYFPYIDSDGLSSESLVTAGIPGLLLHFASPVRPLKTDADSTLKTSVSVLAHSSKDAWTTTSTEASPRFDRYPDTGFPAPDKRVGETPLVVTVTGTFASYAAKVAGDAKAAGKNKPAGKANPEENAPDGDDDDASADKNTDQPKRLLERSPPDSRLAVVGSSTFASDDMLQLSQQTGSIDVAANVDLVANLVDWALEDTELLALRTRGARTRLLRLEDGEHSKWEITNYVIAFALLALVLLFARIRRGRVRPIRLSMRAHVKGTTASGSENAQ